MMNYKLQVKVYTQRDLIESDCFDVGTAIQICENGLKDFDAGKVGMMHKTSMVFNPETQERINCLTSYLPNDGISGIKWISVFPDNPYNYSKPNISAIIVLSDLRTGYPVAIMESSLCSSLRTAAVSAVAGRELSVNNAKNIGIIGAGEQAKMHFLAMKKIRPSIHTCKVASRTIKREIQFINEMQQFHEDVEFIACSSDYQKAVRNADIIVTAISGQKEILRGEWIKSGSFYCHVAGIEDYYSVAKSADKIVCDNWEAVKHREQTISQMYQKGLLKDEDIYADINEIICGHKKGRVNENEFIYFNGVGLPYLDIKLANWMRLKANKNGKGKRIDMREKSMFYEEIERMKASER